MKATVIVDGKKARDYLPHLALAIFDQLLTEDEAATLLAEEIFRSAIFVVEQDHG